LNKGGLLALPAGAPTRRALFVFLFGVLNKENTGAFAQGLFFCRQEFVNQTDLGRFLRVSQYITFSSVH